MEEMTVLSGYEMEEILVSIFTIHCISRPYSRGGIVSKYHILHNILFDI